MSRRLDDLAPDFRPRAVELLARLVEERLPVVIVTTRRTPTEQAEKVRLGLSWTMDSRHLVGRAIDVAPYDMFQLHGDDSLQWDAADPVWQRIGEIGQRVGLKWGVVRGGRRADLGHFEEAA